MASNGHWRWCRHEDLDALQKEDDPIEALECHKNEDVLLQPAEIQTEDHGRMTVQMRACVFYGFEGEVQHVVRAETQDDGTEEDKGTATPPLLVDGKTRPPSVVGRVDGRVVGRVVGTSSEAGSEAGHGTLVIPMLKTSLERKCETCTLTPSRHRHHHRLPDPPYRNYQSSTTVAPRA